MGQLKSCRIDGLLFTTHTSVEWTFYTCNASNIHSSLKYFLSDKIRKKMMIKYSKELQPWDSTFHINFTSKILIAEMCYMFFLVIQSSAMILKKEFFPVKNAISGLQVLVTATLPLRKQCYVQSFCHCGILLLCFTIVLKHESL